MPLCVETTLALSRSHFFFSIRTSASALGFHTYVNGFHSKKPSLPRTGGTCNPYGLQTKMQRTSAGRRILAASGPISTKGTIKHLDNGYPCSTKGRIRLRDNEEEITLPDNIKEGLSTAKYDRPSSKTFCSLVLSPPLPTPLKRFSEMPLAEQAFFLLGSITFMVCGAFIALVATAIPTLHAMKRAALSLERLADTARHELPGTMAAIRLSGMEISDLTLELSDLSEEISESVRNSARAVRAAEVGIRRMGSAAASQTLSMLQEHASGPVEAVRPVVVTAAETTWHAMSQAHKAVLGLAGMPVLSKWIQRKKIEEQKKIDEDDMVLDTDGGEPYKQGGTEVMIGP